MSVNKEASGRRSVQVEIEVPGTPEEVWQAIATGPGISSWFVPAEFEVREGVPTAIKLDFGMGLESKSAVTAWKPPHGWSAQAEGWMPGSPPIANEWTITARDGGRCVVRIVHSLFASSDDWDNQLEGTAQGWPAFLRTLQLYLTHFRGQHATPLKFMAPAAGTEAEAWDALTGALGLSSVGVGEHWTAPRGVPAARGSLEYFTRKPYDALVRLDPPGAGIVALGAIDCGGSVLVALNFYLYGAQAPEVIARQSPQWAAWFARHFPAPAEASAAS